MTKLMREPFSFLLQFALIRVYSRLMIFFCDHLAQICGERHRRGSPTATGTAVPHMPGCKRHRLANRIAKAFEQILLRSGARETQGPLLSERE